MYNQAWVTGAGSLLCNHLEIPNQLDKLSHPQTAIYAIYFHTHLSKLTPRASVEQIGLWVECL